MRNITAGVSDDSYRQARIRTAKNDTSVSAIVQDLLINLPRLARVPAALPPACHLPHSP
jgi:hypothetical protein